MASFDPAIASQLDEVLSKYTQDPYTQVPRVVVLAASSSGLLYSGSAGYASLPPHPASAAQLASAPTVNEESIFEFWSCTKLIAVIAALQLIEQGKVGLKDEAEKWIPELRETKVLVGWEEDGKTPKYEEPELKVTVEMLITHTAGFTYPYSEGHKRMVDMKVSKVGTNVAGSTRESITKIPLMYQPGKHFHYGVNNDWLTLVVEAVSGLSLEAYLQQSIFQPLGITDISFIPNPSKIDMAYRPTPHTFDRGATTGPEKQHSGGSGLQGSPKSFIRILQAILGGGEFDGARILKKETVEDMFRSHLSQEPEDRKRQLEELTEFAGEQDPWAFERGGMLPGSVDWGLGGLLTGLDGKSYSHGRAPNTLCWSGFGHSFWIIDREKDLTYCVWSNLIPYGSKAVFDCWREVEELLYLGAGKRD